MSTELIAILMFVVAVSGIVIGYPLGLVLGTVGLVAGFVVMGSPVLSLCHLRIFEFTSNFIMLAIPLFVFMGIMVEKSGAAESLYGGLYILFGRFRGGLAIGTVLMGTILAACVGLIVASITMIGLVGVPGMLKRKYSKELITGAVCAGGSLGILIPPSVMLVIYGPMAQISVGKLFMAAIVPGLVLAGLYISYIAIACWLKPRLAPSIEIEEKAIPLLGKVRILVAGIFPPVFLIVAVLGAIFFGIASPTEAAAIGCIAASLLAISHRRFNLGTFKATAFETLVLTSKIYIIGWGASMFTGVFLRIGGGEAVESIIMGAEMGKWGTFALIMFTLFILGMFIDWLGILFILVPVMTPIAATLGFDPLWFAMMVVVNLQMSLMTPPFAYAIFTMETIKKPEWEIDIMHIIRGVIPFVLLIMVGMGLLIAFPQLILWLPHLMIKF